MTPVNLKKSTLLLLLFFCTPLLRAQLLSGSRGNFTISNDSGRVLVSPVRADTVIFAGWGRFAAYVNGTKYGLIDLTDTGLFPQKTYDQVRLASGHGELQRFTPGTLLFVKEDMEAAEFSDGVRTILSVAHGSGPLFAPGTYCEDTGNLQIDLMWLPEKSLHLYSENAFAFNAIINERGCQQHRRRYLLLTPGMQVQFSDTLSSLVTAVNGRYIFRTGNFDDPVLAGSSSPENPQGISLRSESPEAREFTNAFMKDLSATYDPASLSMNTPFFISAGKAQGHVSFSQADISGIFNLEAHGIWLGPGKALETGPYLCWNEGSDEYSFSNCEPAGTRAFFYWNEMEMELNFASFYDNGEVWYPAGGYSWDPPPGNFKGFLRKGNELIIVNPEAPVPLYIFDEHTGEIKYEWSTGMDGGGVFNRDNESWTVPPGYRHIFRAGEDMIGLRCENYSLPDFIDEYDCDSAFVLLSTGETPPFRFTGRPGFHNGITDLLEQRVVMDSVIWTSATESFRYDAPVHEVQGRTVFIGSVDSIVTTYEVPSGPDAEEYMWDIDYNGNDYFTRTFRMKDPALFTNYNVPVSSPYVPVDLLSRDFYLGIHKDHYKGFYEDSALVLLSIGSNNVILEEVLPVDQHPFRIPNLLKAADGFYIYTDKELVGPFDTAYALRTGIHAFEGGKERFFSSGGRQVLAPGESLAGEQPFEYGLIINRSGKMDYLDLVSLKRFFPSGADSIVPVDGPAGVFMAYAYNGKETGVFDMEHSKLSGKIEWLAEPGRAMLNFVPDHDSLSGTLTITEGKNKRIYHLDYKWNRGYGKTGSAAEEEQ